MSRLVGPDESSRLVYRTDGTARAQGLIATVYADAGGTQLADILTEAGGVVTGSKLTVDSYSKIPLFQFPDGVDTVYASVNGGPVTPLYARTDDRIDALATRLTAIEPGGGSAALVKSANLSDLASISTARTNLGLGTAATRAVGTTSADVAAGDTPAARYWPSAAVASLTTPMRTAHRTGGNVLGALQYGPAPENSMEGCRLLVEAASGQSIANFVLNVQCRRLADGSAGVVHDDTINRTSSSTGNVSDFTTGAWINLPMDAGTYTSAPGWGDSLRFPLLDDVLREFGGKVPLNIAAYNSVGDDIGAIIVRKVVAAGIGPTVIVSSFSQGQLPAARDAGIATMYYPPDEGQAGSTAAEVLLLNLWASGLPKYVGISSASSDAYIQSFVSAGFHTSVYFTARRFDRDRILALGVQGLISDDPIYQFTNTRIYGSNTVDPYTLGTWPHGALPGDNKVRGALTSNGQQLADSQNGQFSVQGCRCPIDTPTAYTITGSVTFDLIGTDPTRSAQLMLCCPDDRATSGVASSGAGLPDGYSLLIRANGNVELFRNTRSGQGNVKVGSTLATTAITQGTTVPITVQVTSTSIIFTRTDTASSITWTDSTHRGAYYHVGKSGSTGNAIGVSWKITSIA